MGYNYYILIQGLQNNWIDLEYYSHSGSYSGTLQHYFFNNMCKQYQLVGYDFNHDMGESQYVFSYQTLESDYNQYVDNHDFVSKCDGLKDKLVNIAESELNMETIILLHDHLTNIINSNACYFREELEIYYLLCKELSQDYQDIRIVFGISP